MENQRKHERHIVTGDSVVVFDLKTAMSLGHVENISAGGFLLRSNEPMCLDKEFRISLSFPDCVSEKSVVRCTAKSLWSCEAESLWKENDEIQSAYWTGYEFLDLSESGAKTIELLIRSFQLSN